MFPPPFVGESVTAVGELETVPFKDETHRSIQRMDRRNCTDLDTVFAIDDLVDGFVVEFMYLEFEATPSPSPDPAVIEIDVDETPTEDGLVEDGTVDEGETEEEPAP